MALSTAPRTVRSINVCPQHLSCSFLAPLRWLFPPHLLRGPRLIYLSLTSAAAGSGRVWGEPTDCSGVNLGACYWFTDKENVFIEWGEAGRHTLTPTPETQGKPGETIKGFREYDQDPCAAEFLLRVKCPVDFYKALGVRRDAAQKEIGKHYRKLLKEAHIDKQSGKKKKKKKKQGGSSVEPPDIKVIEEAYEVLSDHDRRAAYDQQLMGGTYSQGPFFTSNPTQAMRAKTTAGTADPFSTDDGLVGRMGQDAFRKRDRAAVYVLDFFAPWCSHCSDLAPVFRRVSAALNGGAGGGGSGGLKVNFAGVNCEDEKEFCKAHGVTSYPSVRLYLAREEEEEVYTGPLVEAAMTTWVKEARHSRVVRLGKGNFEADVLRCAHWNLTLYGPISGVHGSLFAQLERAVGGRLLRGQLVRPVLAIEACTAARLHHPSRRGQGAFAPKSSSDHSSAHRK